jgi:hypothetical protein
MGELLTIARAIASISDCFERQSTLTVAADDARIGRSTRRTSTIAIDASRGD